MYCVFYIVDGWSVEKLTGSMWSLCNFSSTFSTDGRSSSWCACVGGLGPFLWPLFAVVGRSWAYVDGLGARLGPMLAVLGRSWAVLGCSWGLCSRSSALLGPYVGGLRPLLGPMLALLGRSWGLHCRSWAALGPMLVVLGRSWGLCWRSWALLGWNVSQTQAGAGSQRGRWRAQNSANSSESSGSAWEPSTCLKYR